MQSLRWPWKLCTTRYNGVYALIIYSIIGYDWTVAKFLWFYYSMLTSFIFHALTPNYQINGICMSFFLKSLESLLRFTQSKTGTSQKTIWWRWHYCAYTSGLDVVLYHHISSRR